MRLTVNLDSESHDTLEELAQGEGMSKSQIVRNAIEYYELIHREWQNVDTESFKWYAKLLGSKEHRIFDIDHTEALMSAIGSPSEDLLFEWKQIGHKHGVEWAGQFDSVEEKLRVLEYCNWYSVTTIADNQYALTTQSESEASLVSSFLKGECEELDFDIDIRQLDQKIIVTDNSE